MNLVYFVQTNGMQTFTGTKFRFYAFVSMLLLVFVHGYNLQNTYLQPFTVVEEPLRLTTFTEYFLANGLFRFRIPMLFVISGYLFAMHDHTPWKQRMGKRLRTLGLPYLIWSAVGMLITLIWQYFPFTMQFVQQAQLDQLGNNSPYWEMNWKQLLERWTLAPIAFQLWFIRVLLIYNALYPFLKWVTRKGALIWFLIIGFFWLVTANVYFLEAEGLFFFSLGIWLQKKHNWVEVKPKWIYLPAVWVVFIGSTIAKSVIAFKLSGMSESSFWILSVLHKTSVLTGLIAVWYGLDNWVRWFQQQPWLVWMSGFSFIIYALHNPLVNYLMRMSTQFTQSFAYHRLFNFLVVPTIVILICVAVGAIFRTLLPKWYAVSTGDRGLQ
jgi:fucose 4-O-acetylase-like acetyltransferase